MYVCMVCLPSHMPCNFPPPSLPLVPDTNDNFGRIFEREFWSVVGHNVKDGYLLDSCAKHCGSWSSVRSEEGMTQQEAFQQWYDSLGPSVRVSPNSTVAKINEEVVEQQRAYLVAEDDRRLAVGDADSLSPVEELRRYISSLASKQSSFLEDALSIFRFNNTGHFPCDACCEGESEKRRTWGHEDQKHLNTKMRGAVTAASLRVQRRGKAKEGREAVKMNVLGNMDLL
ncbi:hypothetical protein Naga_100555g4 [Nannochloropsis gaditana]|uniref:Uncharacterized protein n=1 Tax=Nannochloropsis gaditana TaxID=72520 RepID=W7T5E0_9STRA|nr:hypothetical protein Naga_100555g4 [Nannochloropsis gaditana]